MTATYLQVHPGGQRFGPFHGGTITVGAHPSGSSIVLSAPGVAPRHCQILCTGPGQYTVSPVERGLGVWIIQAGDTQRWPVQAPVLAKPGDSLIFGTESGPCFVIQAEQAPKAGFGQSRQGQSSAFANAMQSEVKRQVFSHLVYRNPIVRDLYNYSYRFRSGGLTNPRFVIGLLGSVLSLIGVGIAACAGTGLAAWQYVAHHL